MSSSYGYDDNDSYNVDNNSYDDDNNYNNDIFKDSFKDLKIRSALHCLFDHYLPSNYGNDPKKALEDFLETEGYYGNKD